MGLFTEGKELTIIEQLQRCETRLTGQILSSEDTYDVTARDAVRTAIWQLQEKANVAARREMLLDVGYLVEAVSPFKLASSETVYKLAVVAMMRPFVLISLDGKMRWDTVKFSEIHSVGLALPATMEVVRARLRTPK